VPRGRSPKIRTPCTSAPQTRASSRARTAEGAGTAFRGSSTPGSRRPPSRPWTAPSTPARSPRPLPFLCWIDHPRAYRWPPLMVPLAALHSSTPCTPICHETLYVTCLAEHGIAAGCSGSRRPSAGTWDRLHSLTRAVELFYVPTRYPTNNNMHRFSRSSSTYLRYDLVEKGTQWY
jgi:hypothetical protein